MVEYSTTTIERQGVFVDGNITYDINTRVVNDSLERLVCNITKVVKGKVPDGNGGMVEGNEPVSIGFISFEQGRQTSQLIQDENIIQYLTRFQEIYNEVMGITGVQQAKK